MILDKIRQSFNQERQIFDPENKVHLAKFKFFLENGKWENVCPFFLEEPWVSIPDMVKDRIVRNVLKNKNMES